MGIVNHLSRTCTKSQFEIVVKRIHEYLAGCQTVRTISIRIPNSSPLCSLLTTLTRGFPHIPNAPIGGQQQQQQQASQQTAIVKP